MKYLKLSLLIIICYFSLTLNVNALRGIDVSAYQRDIDFSKVKNEGIEVVYIRSSAGNSYIDPYFRSNYEKAKDNNLKVGFYHFVTARNSEEAQEQARFFAHVVSTYTPDAFLVMDFEVFRGLSRDEVNQIATTFLKTLSDLTNKKVMVYSDAYNANRVYNKEISSSYPLWIAEYGPKEPTSTNWESWDGWQYTDKGLINGINGYVDRDEFKESIFYDEVKPIDKPNIDKTTKKVIYYHVKRKDILLKIAKEYKVTVNQLVNWNNIKNPNRISVGEILKIYPRYDYTIPSAKVNSYVVKPGDTLSKIAQEFGISLNELIIINHLINPNLIYPGQVLILNNSNRHLIKYIIKKGDTLSEIARDFNTTTSELAKINKIKNPNIIRVNEELFIPEVTLY